METRTRTLAKAASWQALGLVTTTLITWLASGSWAASLSAALGAAFLGFVCYFLHERAWAAVKWGRQSAQLSEADASARTDCSVFRSDVLDLKTQPSDQACLFSGQSTKIDPKLL